MVLLVPSCLGAALRGMGLLSALLSASASASGAPPAPAAAFPIPAGTDFQLLPCKAGLPRQRIALATSTKATPPSTLVAVAGAGNQSCLSCPGEDGKGTASCHAWGCDSLDPDSVHDRNDLFFINGSLASPFYLSTYPATAAVPTGKGLMAPGQCLVPASPGGAIADAVHAADCASGQQGLWTYDASTQQLRHNSSQLCLDAGSPFSLDCWSPDSPTFSFPMCDPTLPAEARARDIVSRMRLEEKGHNLGGQGGWGGSAGVPRLGATSSCLAGKKTGILDSSEALHGLGQAGCGETTFFAEFGGNNTGCPASFPHALALGSTFNRSLWGLIGDQISTEARAAWNIGKEFALWLWAP